MNILIIGSGGREHAIAWKISKSPLATKIFALPGNPGIGELAENVEGISVDDHQAVIEFCKRSSVDLVIIGPEIPLAAGMADALVNVGIRCFGPSKSAARLESSKVFSKDFMTRHRIPTARYETFKDPQEAIKHIETVTYPIVIKASGLAAGKGVILPVDAQEAKAALVDIMENKSFGDAGVEVVIEERLSGPEVSLMAFTDGNTIIPMIPAQDHKRLLDGDEGPNTGGMGSYAPAPVFTKEQLEETIKTVLRPAIDGLKKEDIPYIGVLYAGLMLTPQGIRVLEFNCRFGDPETQVVLPLLDTDLVGIAIACADGHLKDVDVRWKDGAAVCVVLASEGYPEQPQTGKVVSFGELQQNLFCFHAGTKRDGDKIVTAGGRVFGLTAWGKDIRASVEDVYDSIEKISFDGVQFRSDIAHRALKRSAYAGSGVDIDAGNRAVELMKEAVKASYTPSVLAGIGSFGGLFDVSDLKDMFHPVLVGSTDGVGTKVMMAAGSGGYKGIGHDIVNHCIDDILVQGARPLFFMDYFATSKLKPEQTAEVVAGIAEACKEAGMALLGGETAEMPGVYQQNEFDLAGTIIGVVEREAILPRVNELIVGDVLIGFRSSGPHTNGFSLIRKIFEGKDLAAYDPRIGSSLLEALLEPHRAYYNLLYPNLHMVKALAHITGGGFIENIPRILPKDLDAVVNIGSWPIPPLWDLVQEEGDIAIDEMYRVFNMGIGMVAVVDKDKVSEIQGIIQEDSFIIGELIAGTRRTILK